MNVVVFGATGLVGHYTLEELLAKQHHVTILVRNRSRVPSHLVTHPKLTIVEGDVLVRSDVEKVLAHQTVDAIVFTVSEESVEQPLKLLSRAMRILLDVVHTNSPAKEGKKLRLMHIAGVGVLDAEEKDPHGQVQYFKDASTFPQKYIPPASEHIAAIELFKKDKDLEWTVFCPPLMEDKPAEGNYELSSTAPATLSYQLNAGNLAQLVVGEMVARKHVHERVGIVKSKW